MFFGMSNSPASFQASADKIFGPLRQKYGKQFRNYMDNICIRTYKGEKELHIQIIKDLLKICLNNELHLKLSKSIFMAPEMLRPQRASDFLECRQSQMDSIQH